MEVKEGATTIATFEYDGAGRRTEKVSAGTTHQYIYDGEDIVEDRITGTGSDTLRYYHGEGFDEPLARKNSTDAVTYYLADHLGSVVQETNSSGSLAFQREYDAWGVSLVGGSESGYGFTGREWDAEVSLQNSRYRIYDPAAGRFLSEDPIGLLGGINLATYVANGPLTLSDPLGLCSEQPNSSDQQERFKQFERQYREARTDRDRAEILRRILGDPDLRVSEAGMPNARKIALQALERALAKDGALFGSKGILNNGQFFRIGRSRDGGEDVFRLAGEWVEKYAPQAWKTPDGKHIIWFRFGPL